MATVRKQTGTRLQRIRAFPNFGDWTFRTPMELTQKLGRFEKSLRGIFGDLGNLLLSVVDGNRTPDYRYGDIDTLKFEGTAVSIAKTSEGFITVTINDTSTFGGTPLSVSTSNVAGSGPAGSYFDHQHDHGAQSTSNHHAPAAGSSLNGFLKTTTGATIGWPPVVQADGSHAWADTLLAMDQIASNGAGSILLNWDEVYLLDSGSFLDCNNGQIRDVSRIDRTVGDISIEAESGTVAVAGSVEVDLSAPTIDINGTGGSGLVDIDGVNVFVGGTTEIDLFSPLIDINATTTLDIDAGASTLTTTGSNTINTTNGTIFIDANGTGQDVRVTADDAILQTAVGLIQIESTNNNIALIADTNSASDITATAADRILLSATNDVDVTALRLDMNDNPVESISVAEFSDQEPPAPPANDTGVSTNNGAWRVRGSSGAHLFDYAEYVVANITDPGTTVTVDLTDVGGIDFSEGIIRVRVDIMVTPQTASTNLTYGESRDWWLHWNHGSGAYTTKLNRETQAWTLGSFLAGSCTASASHVLSITRNTMAYTANLTMRIRISAAAA